MKTAEEWITKERPRLMTEPAVEIIRAIQADALRHAADLVNDSVEAEHIDREADRIEQGLPPIDTKGK